jgi:nitrogen fixation/metabolism regulation signal transduction histidine kinase
MKTPRGPLLLALVIVSGLAGLGLLTQAMQNSGTLGQWHDLILLANGAGALALAGVLAVNLGVLLRERRGQVPGAGLKLRLLAAFGAIAAAPVLVVFLVAVQFLHRGIETWADDSIAAEIGRSLQLSRKALDPELDGALARTREAAARLSLLPAEQMAEALPVVRRAAGARDMSLLARNYRIVAASSAGPPGGSLGVMPGEDVVLPLARDGSYVAVEPDGPESLRLRTAVTLSAAGEPAGELLILQALYPVGGPLGALAGSVQRIYTRYGESVFLREPLESGFTVALAVVLLLALFTALYGALVFARRLVAPIRSLVAGTRAVAAGHLDTRLPVTSRDDIGTLVESFNDMAARLDAARTEAQRNAEQIDRARASLATVLARLTSGVIAVDEHRRLRIANDAADAILHAGLRGAAGRALDEIGQANPHLAGFFEACEQHSRASPSGWREQISLPGESTGRRVLMCSAAPLPYELGQGPGYVLVFDDITAMLQAQREAAWGEVARRLAHEIKNPLTPIQLSAERIRRRYLGALPAAETELLDRATHTIVQQVEALRDMVNAFGEYARAPEISFAPLDLNGLVREVADLYHGPQQPGMRVDLDATLTSIEADAVRLRQLLHNLIRNACEALENTPEPRVTISTRLRGAGAGGLAEIRVEDNGPGINLELLERIFEPYVTSKTRGTGLGLAIVRRLVEEHGGNVAAENPAGGGACVIVTLPVSQASRDLQADPRLRRAGERR